MKKWGGGNICYSLINFRLINITDTASKLDTCVWKYFDIKELSL